MQAKKYQGSEEKTVLTAIIVHDRILEQVMIEAGSKDYGPFKNRWSNIIAGWCFNYYRKHGKAPGGIIKDIFVKYAQQEEDQDAVALIEKFLSTLSGEYQKLEAEINEGWVLEKAAELFAKVRLEKMTESVEAALDRHDVQTAWEAVQEFRPVSFGSDAWVNVFSNTEIRKTVEQMDKAKPVIEFKGGLGRFLSPYFEHDGFISFAAPEKRGKSFWLQEMVWQAISQRKKVIYYAIGDMSIEQVKRRLYSRMTGRPRKTSEIRYIKKVAVANDKDEAGFPQLNVTFEDPINVHGFTERDIRKARKRVRMNMALKKWPLRIRCEGAGILSASQISTDIKNLAREGFIADVVVIDYADLLAPEPGVSRLDFRHQVDDTWKILRRTSTENHLLMITATQAAARSYSRWLLKKEDFSEDKRKNAHVTGMLGINQTAAEKKKGIYRLNWIFLRDGEWTDTQYVWTVGNLALGCPCLKSLL